MAVHVSDIAATDWAIKLDVPGEVVEGLDDINQCLRTILATPKGSRAHEPLFGCDLWQYLDQPITAAVPKITAAVIEAVELWEPRVRLVSVSPVFDEAATGRVTLRLEWQLKGSAATQQTRVSL